MKQTGGKHKMKRSSKKKPYFAGGFRRVARNKVRRLKKRLSFDPSAGPAIKRIESKAFSLTPNL